MFLTRVASRVCIPIITVVLIVWLLFSAVTYFSPSEPLIPLIVDKTLLHVSNALRIIKDQVDFSRIAGQSSLNHFLPPVHYERDPRGAIDILERRGYVVCRVYVACRDRSSQILLPLWMRNHANLLSEKCALSNFRFVHYSRLQNYPPSPAIYDWLGPQVPAPALRAFIANPLSHFFSSNNASKTKLSSSPSLHRSCMGPNESRDKNISVCDDDPEPRIARPVIILNVHPDHPFVRSDYYNVFRQAIRNVHATDLVIWDPSSDMLARNRVCFRSLVSTPSIDRLTGQTDLNPSEFESLNEQNGTISSIVGEALEEADRVIDYALRKEESLGLSSFRAQASNIDNEAILKMMGSKSVNCFSAGNATVNCLGLEKNETSLFHRMNHSLGNGTREHVEHTSDNLTTPSWGRNTTDGLVNDTYEVSLVTSHSQNSSGFFEEQKSIVKSFETSTGSKTDWNISMNATRAPVVRGGTLQEKNISELFEQSISKLENDSMAVENSSSPLNSLPPIIDDSLEPNLNYTYTPSQNRSHVTNDSVITKILTTRDHTNVSVDSNQFFSSGNETFEPRPMPSHVYKSNDFKQSLHSENLSVVFTELVNTTSDENAKLTSLDTNSVELLQREQNSTQTNDQKYRTGDSSVLDENAEGMVQNKSTENPDTTTDVNHSSREGQNSENRFHDASAEARVNIKGAEIGNEVPSDSNLTTLNVAHGVQEFNNTPELETDSGCDTSMLNDVFDLKDNISTKFQLFDKLSLRKVPKVTRTNVDKRIMDNGGIELFTHRSVHGTYWNNLTPESAHYGICRLYKVCRNSDSTLLLPAWLENYRTILRQHCGFSRAKFIPNVEFDTMYTKILNDSDGFHGFNHILATTGLKTPSNMEMNLDLIGTRVYRAQEQHFVTDLFHDAIHSIDAVLNYRESNDSPFRRECVYRPPNAIGAEVVKCENDSPYTPALRPVFVMNNLIKKRNKATRFIRGLVSMIPPRAQDDTRMVFTADLSQTGKNNATCFRSILLTHDVYPPQSVLHETEHNAFYEHNMLKRDSIINKVRSRRDKSFRSPDNICHIQMTVLQPRKADEKFRQLGKIDNEDQVLEEAVRVADAVAAKHGLNGMELHIKMLLHNTVNIAQAARIIQQSEVVLGGNSPAMTNIMFARPQTAIVEIQSFGYSTGPYRSFARALNLTYTSVMARPDVSTFEKCVMDKYDRNWGSDVQKDEMEARRNGLLRIFRDAADSFDGVTSAIDLTSLLKQDGSKRRGYIPLERVCARQQQLAVNEEMVGRIVSEQAATICEMKLGAKK